MPKELVGATFPDAAPPASGRKQIVGATFPGEPIDYESKKFEMGPQLKSNSQVEENRKQFMDLLPIAMGTLGGMAAGPFAPLGAAAGAAGGAFIRNIGNPDTLDTAKDVGVQGTVQGLTEGVAPYVSKGLSRAKDWGVEKLVRLFSSHVPEETRAATDLGVPLTVGQATDSAIPKFLERTLTSDAKRTAIAEEQKKALEGIEGKLRVRFTGSPTKVESPDEYFGIHLQKGMKENATTLGQETNDAFKKFKFDAKANSRTIQIPDGENPPSSILDALGNPATPSTPKFVEKTIPGAIDVGSDTRQFATSLSPKLRDIANGLPDGIPEKAQYLKFANDLDHIASGEGGTGVHAWETLKELRSSINSGAGSQIDKTRLEGGLTKLSSLLGRDIENGVAGWAENGPQALVHLKAANLANETEKTIFNPRVNRALYKNGNIYMSEDASKVADKMLESPEATREFLDALGTPDKQRAAKGVIFERLISTAKSNPDAALDILDNPSHKLIFSQSDRSDLTNFFRTVKRVAPDESKWGQASVYLKGAGIVLAGSKGLYDYATGDGDIPPSALEGAALLFGANKFGEKVLLNPRYARTAARLATLAPDSGEASFARKTILSGLRGVQGLIELKNGEKRNFTVTKEGKIKVDNSDQQ